MAARAKGSGQSNVWAKRPRGPALLRVAGQATSVKRSARAFRAVRSIICQTLSGPLPRSGSPAREAAAPQEQAVAPQGHFFDENLFKFENGPQRKAIIDGRRASTIL